VVRVLPQVPVVRVPQQVPVDPVPVVRVPPQAPAVPARVPVLVRVPRVPVETVLLRA
jgi:hypothetical protein